MSSTSQIRIAGIGGQGAVIAADLLGEAGLLAGRHVAGSTRYGSAARGTPVRADLILSAEPIDDPHVHEPELLVAMCQEAYDLYAPGVRADGTVLYDDGEIAPRDLGKVNQHAVPALQTALKQVGNRQTANLVLVGALLALTELLPLEALERAIVAHVSPRFHEVNQQALRLGFQLGRAPGAD